MTPILILTNVGINTGLISHCCAYYGEGSGPIQIESFSCSGSEANITSCSSSSESMDMYDHQYDVGVQCQKGSRGVYHCVYRTI